MQKNKLGFTLVELSIVLVIIGLLIGGILVGKSLINAAKTQSFVRNIQQFDAAVSSFRQKFKGLPGDTRSMGCINYGGNTCNDGMLVSSAGRGGGSLTPDTDGEIGHFWVDLQKSGFKGGKTFKPYDDDTGATRWDFSSNNPHSPMARASVDAGIASMQCQWAFSEDGFQRKNCYTIYSFDPNALNESPDTYYSPPLFTINDSMSIDSKMDDGKPMSGDIRNEMQAVDEGSSNDPDCSNGNTYKTTTDDGKPHCYMQIHMLHAEDGFASVD